MKIEQILLPSSHDVDFLTARINESAKKLGINEEAYPFAFFIRDDQGVIKADSLYQLPTGANFRDDTITVLNI